MYLQIVSWINQLFLISCAIEKIESQFYFIVIASFISRSSIQLNYEPTEDD
jgi:hypothetical protein